MDLKGKKFVNSEGIVRVVKDFFDNVTVFEDGGKVDTRILLNSKFYTELPSGNNNTQQNSNQNMFRNPVNETIDPNQFFNQRNTLLNNMTERINSISSDVIERMPVDSNGRVTPTFDNNFMPTDNSSAIYTVSAETEAEEIARKYRDIENDRIRNINKQAASLKADPLASKSLEEEGITIQTDIPQTTTNVVQPQIQHQNQPQPPQYNHYEEGRASVSQMEPVMQGNYTSAPSYVDPMIAVFKKSKMNTDFLFTIEINKKIPKLAYIEMMEESCETSIIDYLATEFTESILRNPNAIKDKIAEELRRLVEEPRKKTKKEPDVKLPLPTETPKRTVKSRVLPHVDVKDTEELNEGIQRKIKSKNG